VRRALLVGINAYPRDPLLGCANDARALQQVLQRQADGSPNFECRLLTAPPQPITRSILRAQATELFAQEAEVALFFFSGHGTENLLGGYLVTPDAERYDEGLPMADLLTLANRSPVREVVIVLDCCSSGALGQAPALDGLSAQLREGVSVLTASRASQPSLEVGGWGLFSSLVHSALDGGAADVIGNVTAAGIYAYVDQALGPWQQRPLFKTHVSRLTSLRKCSPAVPLATLRRLPEWFTSPEAYLQLDPSFEPDVEPHDPEHEAIFAQLQKCRAAKLVEPVGEEHLYFAAIRSKACRLTPLGHYYWRLAREARV
jgi:uncharacterized caspase-like protein